LEWCLGDYRERPSPADLTNTLFDKADRWRPRAARGALHQERERPLDLYELIVSVVTVTADLFSRHESRVWSRFSMRPTQNGVCCMFRMVAEPR
jgi:hypothetical protein